MAMRVAIGLVGMLLGVVGSATAQEGTWRPLVDGGTLEGWRRLGGEAEYRVEDGAIVGVTKARTPNTFLATEAVYSDFVLELEFHVDAELNSGVQVRSESRADYRNGVVHGYQVEIDPTTRAWTAGIYDEQRRGWLFPVEHDPRAQRALRHGEWNHLRIDCRGDVIRTWLNGVPVAYLVDGMTPRGFVALQVHSVADELVGRQVRWRNIRLLELDAAAGAETHSAAVAGDFPLVVNLRPNTLTERERELGWRLLWDGRTTTGWRGAHRDAFPAQGWVVENGELTVLESGGREAGRGGDIVTVEELSAFELELEFRLTEGANSGIKYYVTEGYDAAGGSAIGLEYQILDDERHPDAKLGRDGNRTLASLYDLVPASKEPRFVRPLGEWNHARIVSRGDGSVEHWLNHRKVLAYERGSTGFLELVKTSKYKDWPGFGLWERGHLLLQDHGNRVSFRSIKVRELE
jgi:hypothetical protein